MLRKLRVKFVVINMTIVTIMLCVIFGLVYHFTKTSLETASVNMMQALASGPFRPGRPDEQPDGVRLPYFTLQVGTGGELIAAGGGYYDLSDEAFLEQLADAAFSFREPTGVIEKYNLRFCRVSGPGGQWIVFADISSELAALSSLWKTCVLIGSVGFLLFLGISLFLAKWAVKPVDRAWKQQRQFAADASHELKTPLTVIMTNAELLQSGDYDEPSRARFSESILMTSRQMRGLVERLLELARADSGQDKPAAEKVDLSKTAVNAILPFEPVFFEKGLTLVSQIEQGVIVSGSEQRLHQVLDILLDNAQKYALPPGEVWAKLRRCGRNRCELSVSNPGEAISEEDLKNVFKRFYRADKARSRNGSFGLGLSIAESVVREHHGKIWVESGGGRNTFFVELPTV